MCRNLIIMNSTLHTLNKTCFNATLGKGAVRECDKILCLRVYKYMMGLTYFIEPSEDLKAVLTRDMFVKSNPKAFFLVMHYLFMALDPSEFKQRFYWPLDKNTENTFRTNTVKYLNDLNIKYELDLGTVQTYIVVMPGGTKFLIVLLKLLRLVMRDVVKKKQKVGSLNDIKINVKSEHFTKQYMVEMTSKSKMWHEKSTKLVKKYLANATVLENYSISLRNHLHALINVQTASINSNMYSAKINERDITEILNHNFTILEEQTAHYEEYTTILHKFKTTVYKKINTNSTSLVEFDSAHLQKSTVLLAKYNNESVLDSSTDKLVKSKLSNLFVPNKSMINLIDLYNIIIYYAGQIKLQFFSHSNMNVKNLQINANVLDQYLIRLNKNSIQLTNLKCSINKYKKSIGRDLLDSTKLVTDSNTSTAVSQKINIMMTPRLKWTNLNDMAVAQPQIIMQPSDNILCSANNNTILLSALLSSKKINRSAHKRTRFSNLTESLNLDSSRELLQSTGKTTTTSSSNKFSKINKNFKINLNTNKFESPVGNNPALESQACMYKSILKNRNQPLATDIIAAVSVSPTGKCDSLIKIEPDEDVEDTLLFKRSGYSTNEETIKNRPGYSSSLIGCRGFTSANSSTEIQKTEMLSGDESNESGFEVLQISDNVETSLKRRDSSNGDYKYYKYPYRIIDTIDLTASVKRVKSIPSPTASSELHAGVENNRNQTNIRRFLTNDIINLLDTSDSCLNDFTLLN